MIVYNNKSDLTNVYLGNTNIAKVYVGTHQVYPSSTPPTPTGFKFMITHFDNYISSAACDSTSSITRSEILSTFVSPHTIHTARAIEIGDCVTEVASAACSSMENVSAVTIPNSVITIGDSAFEKLDNASALTIPNSVISIGNNAFFNWKSISSVTIPNSVQTIGNGAFSQNGYAGAIVPCINHFEVGMGVIYIGSGAFYISNENLTVDVIMHPTTPPSFADSGDPFQASNTSASYNIYIPNAVWNDYMAASQWYALRSYAKIHFYTIDPEYRTVSTATTCVGTDKYAVNEYQVSYDMWQTYTTTGTSIGELIEADCPACETPYHSQYFTMVALENGTFKFKRQNQNNLLYSKDSGATWTEINVTNPIVSVNAGDKVMWKYTSSPSSSYGIGSFSANCRFDVEGNAMSLYYSDNFLGQTTLPSSNAFRGLFSGATTLVSAENLVLPSTTLTNGCYYNMFFGCTSLTTAPKLIATTLAQVCYWGMFQNCSNLTSITCLATDISAYSCTKDWTNGVAANGTFTKSASMTSWTTGVDGIPSGWTVQDYTE